MKSNQWEEGEADVRTHFRRILVKCVREGRWNWLIVLISAILGTGRLAKARTYVNRI